MTQWLLIFVHHRKMFSYGDDGADNMCFFPLNVRHFDIVAEKSTSASNDIINGWIPFSSSSARARVVLARACHFSSLPFHHICLIAWDGMRRILVLWELVGGSEVKWRTYGSLFTTSSSTNGPLPVMKRSYDHWHTAAPANSMQPHR